MDGHILSILPICSILQRTVHFPSKVPSNWSTFDSLWFMTVLFGFGLFVLDWGPPKPEWWCLPRWSVSGTIEKPANVIGASHWMKPFSNKNQMIGYWVKVSVKNALRMHSSWKCKKVLKFIAFQTSPIHSRQNSHPNLKVQWIRLKSFLDLISFSTSCDWTDQIRAFNKPNNQTLVFNYCFFNY